MSDVDLSQALEALPDAVLASDATGRVSFANEAAEERLGAPRDRLVGQSLAVLAPPRLRDRYERLLARILRRAPTRARRIRVVALRGDGREAHLEVALRAWAGGLVLSLRDLPARAEVHREGSSSDADLIEREHAARARLTTQLEVARALSEAPTLGDALALVLGALGENLAWDAARFWRVDPAAVVLRDEAAWRAAPSVPGGVALLRDEPSGHAAPTHRYGEGGPGRAWQMGEPFWSADATEPRELRDGTEGLRGVFWFPVRRRGEVHGVLELVSVADRPAHDRLFETMRGLGDQLAQFLERTEIREALEASEQHLATTLRCIADAVISTDVRGNVVFMNPVAEQLTGWPFQDARGRPLADVFYAVNEDDRTVIENPVARVLRDGLVVGLANHTALVARNGNVHSIEDSGAPILSDAGELLGVVMIFRDVTQVRRADKRRRFLAQAAATLATSIDYAQTASNLAHLAVPRLADWCVVHVVEDERAGLAVPLAVAHVDPAKASWARTFYDRFPTRRDADHGLYNVLRTGESELYPAITDDLLVRASTSAQHLEVLRGLAMKSLMIVPLVAHGRSIGAITFVAAESAHRYDDADLAMAEELAGRAALAIDNARLHRSLQEGEERTRLVLESVGEAIVGIDLRGCCVFANPACARLLAYESSEKLLGKDIRDLTSVPLDSRVRPRGRRIDELCLEDGPAHVAEELFGRADGSSFCAECWSYPIVRAGVRVGAVITFIDISERKRAEEEHVRLLGELEDAVRLRDDFLSIASHELRTPLTPLQLHVQGMQRALKRGSEAIAPAELLVRLDSVARQITRIERLVDNLLDIARITSKRMLLQLEELDLGVLVRDVVARHRDEVARIGSEVRLEVEGEIVGEWDQLRLDQVLSNLLANAMKFGPGKPIDVHVTALPDHAGARIVVQDHGIGIPMEDQRRIFERFERAVPSRHYGGFGLGLWIVRQIVEAMGGTVAVESVPGEGATFTVDVPIHAVTSAAPHALAS